MAKALGVECWANMVRVSRIYRKPNDSILNEVNETGKTLGTVQVRRWNMMGHALRYADKDSIRLIIRREDNKCAKDTEDYRNHHIYIKKKRFPKQG